MATGLLRRLRSQVSRSGNVGRLYNFAALGPLRGGPVFVLMVRCWDFYFLRRNSHATLLSAAGSPNVKRIAREQNGNRWLNPVDTAAAYDYPLKKPILPFLVNGNQCVVDRIKPPSDS